MVLIKDINKRNFTCKDVTEEMFDKLTELGGEVKTIFLDGKNRYCWVFPMRKKNSVIDYFLMFDIDYKKD